MLRAAFLGFFILVTIAACSSVGSQPSVNTATIAAITKQAIQTENFTPIMTRVARRTEAPRGEVTSDSFHRATIAPTTTEFVLVPDRISTSPDGEWIAKVFDTYPFSIMEVHHSEGALAWQLEYNGEADGWYEVTLRPIHWSADGKYLYLTVDPFVDGFVLFKDGSGLQRLNLENGIIEDILPGDSKLSVFSLSPDSSFLAYIQSKNKRLQLIIRNITTESDWRWTLDARYTQAGRITWSPDGNMLVLLMAIGDRQENLALSTARVDLKSMSFIELVRDEWQFVKAIEWLDGETILVEDWDQNRWRLDVNTGMFTVLPKPTPSP